LSEVKIPVHLTKEEIDLLLTARKLNVKSVSNLLKVITEKSLSIDKAIELLPKELPTSEVSVIGRIEKIEERLRMLEEKSIPGKVPYTRRKWRKEDIYDFLDAYKDYLLWTYLKVLSFAEGKITKEEARKRLGKELGKPITGSQLAGVLSSLTRIWSGQFQHKKGTRTKGYKGEIWEPLEQRQDWQGNQIREDGTIIDKSGRIVVDEKDNPRFDLPHATYDEQPVWINENYKLLLQTYFKERALMAKT